MLKKNLQQKKRIGNNLRYEGIKNNLGKARFVFAYSGYLG